MFLDGGNSNNKNHGDEGENRGELQVFGPGWSVRGDFGHAGEDQH